MLYPLLEQYDIDCKRAITYGFSRTEAGFELKKELPDAGLYAVFAITGKRFEVNVFDAYTDEDYLPFNVAENTTGFVTGIREQVETLVQEIKEKCLLKANMKLRLMEYCTGKFGTKPVPRMTRAIPPPSPTTWATTWATWPAWGPTCTSPTWAPSMSVIERNLLFLRFPIGFV